jgi:hypothetical protein
MIVKRYTEREKERERERGIKHDHRNKDGQN